MQTKVSDYFRLLLLAVVNEEVHLEEAQPQEKGVEFYRG
jgi:hypothetical protein